MWRHSPSRQVRTYTDIFDALIQPLGILGQQVATTSAFTTDLGLDSLDAVEVVMAIEEEFNIVSILPRPSKPYAHLMDR